MPFKAYEIYKEYEPDKYKTSTEKKVEKALEEAKKEGLVPRKEAIEFQEAKEIFKEDFLGLEAIKTTFDIELSQEELEQIEQIPFSKEELEQAKELGMMLVLRVPHDKEDKPLTLNRMREIFAGEDKLGDPKKKKQQLFYRQPGDGWYKDEEFATKANMNLGWGLVAKEVLPESRSKNWDEQEEILKQWAKANKLDPATIRRRTPVEVVYDTMIYYGANKKSLLEKDYDWTAFQSSGGWFVGVGLFDSVGLRVFFDARGFRSSYLGVCPAR